MIRRKTLAIFIAFLSLFALRAGAQINKIQLIGPASPIDPGMVFDVRLEFVFVTQVQMTSYHMQIEYNTNYITLENAFPDSTNLDWLFPVSSENTQGGYAEIVDNSIPACSQKSNLTLIMAHLNFRAKTTLPPGLINSLIHINPTYSTVWDCSSPTHFPVTVSSWQDGYFSSFVFQQTTFGVEQYLDLDGNTLGTVTDSDIDILRDIVFEKRYDSSGQYTLKIGGLQGDINGNTEVDVYDYGYMDAVARTIRFIGVGPNGICETYSNIPPPSDPDNADDVQEITVGYGAPNEIVINGDTGNMVLESTPGGDDFINGNLIRAGANGIAESTRGGDDQRLITNGQGAPGKICVSPGPNGYLVTTTTGGDDVMITDPRPVGDLLAANPMAGAPAKIVRIAPNAAYTYYDHKQIVPIVVSVQTADGFPKLGVAPVFTAQGGGTFQGSGTNTMSGWVSDLFLDRGGIPSGNVTVVFNPVVGDNTITVSVPGNPSKGVPTINTDPIHIVVLNNSQSIYPDILTLSADASSAHVNEPIGLTFTLKDGTTIAPGFADKMYLISQRNMLEGAGLSNLNRGNYNTVFYDDFESGSLTGWTVISGCGPVMIDGNAPGLFGIKSVHVTGVSPINPCSLQKMISTTAFSDIMVQFQWAFTGGSSTANIKGYWSSNGTTWRPFMNTYPINLPPQFMGKMMSEGFDMSQYREIENSQIYIKLVFYAMATTFYLDNVQVTGKHEMLYEDFQSYSVGVFPSSMDPSGWINAGSNGICQTTAQGDDQQLIAVNNGKADEVYLYPGKDLILDSIPGGDDQLVLSAITSGANGIAETIVLNDDFSIIPYGEGLSFATCVTPGFNNSLDTANASGDDVRQNTNGPNPWIAVDNSISGQSPGSNKFLFIGRSTAGANKDSYAVRKIVNLENVPEALLSFKFQTAGIVDGGTIKQKFVVEVSNNGGESFLPIWDFAGTEMGSWSQVDINLTDDPRFNVSDDFIIQWRATMNSTENDTLDPDAVYLDEIVIYAAAPSPDKFTPIIDLYNGTGNYHSNLITLAPGNTIKIAAVYFSSSSPPVFSNAVQVAATLRKVDPNSVKIYPEELNLMACKSQTMNVVGHFMDLPGETTEDITSLFKLVVQGPAKQTAPGVITMDCYRGPDPYSHDPIPINIRALPRVPGLLDPVGGGGGTQTGNISGRIYTPTYTGAATSSLVIDMGAGGKVYATTDSSGYYTVTGVPVGTGYNVDGSKQGYTLSHKTGNSVSAGLTTTVNPVLATGANCDGDSYMDTSDTDDDGDGVADGSEGSGCGYKPDCDNDGYPDNTDEFPSNASEWEDTDNDGTGDNADTDDDGDGILDSEEIVTGADGYITNSKSADTDGDGLSDYYETHNGLNPTVSNASSDQDSDGRRNYDEYLDGTNPVVAEPVCGEGAYCFADSDGNGIIEVPDLVGLNSVLGGIAANWTQVIPTNGDQMDLDGNGVIEVPDLILINSLIGGSMSGDLPGQADSVNLESSQNVTTTVGQWTKLTVNLTSSVSAGSQKRSGYGVIFYVSSTSSGGTGEFWGGDKASTSRSGGRWCTTLRMVSQGGRSEIWFKATHTGHVYIQAEAPASAMKHTKQVQLVTPVHVTIN